jgi:hypothetical protein
MDRRKLFKEFYLVIENITFASDAIGAAAGTGRTADTAWAANAEVIFKGQLRHILTFGLMAFSVNDVAIVEDYSIVPDADFLNVMNLGALDLVDIISLDPADGEGIVVADDLTFLQNLTNNYRANWSDTKAVIRQEKADATNKAFFRGTVLETLAYAYQFDQVDGAPVYTLYNLGLAEYGAQLNKGVTWPPITGASGPVELEPAHVTLGNILLGVNC